MEPPSKTGLWNPGGINEGPREGRSWLWFSHRRSIAARSRRGSGVTNAAPRLSVGLAVYNGENYLAESIEALLGQTFEDFELIISDNASTDATPDICRRYEKQDSRIRYFRQAGNIGCAA